MVRNTSLQMVKEDSGDDDVLEERIAVYRGAGGSNLEGDAPINKKAEEHATARRKARKFLFEGSPPPKGALVVLRMIFHVIESMQALEFKVGSIRWEKLQAAKAAERLRAGVDDEMELLRDYGVLFHCRGELERMGCEKIRLLSYDTRLWLLIPEEECNILSGRVHLYLCQVWGAYLRGSLQDLTAGLHGRSCCWCRTRRTQMPWTVFQTAC